MAAYLLWVLSALLSGIACSSIVLLRRRNTLVRDAARISACGEVTRQSDSAERLRESEERFSLAVSGMNDGIWDFSLVSDQAYHSDRCRELLGLQPGEKFSHDTLFERMHPDDRDASQRAIRNHLEARVPLDIEYRVQIAANQYRWFRARGCAVWDDNGKPVRMVGSITDISNHKAQEEILRNYNRELWEIKSELERQARELAIRSEELELARRQAEHASRVKTDFLANMSHEIRTPMNAILGYTNLLISEKQSEEQREQSLRTIRRNGEHLLSVINDILDITKIEAGKMTLERINCSISRIVADVSSFLRVPAREKSITFDVEYLTPVPETMVSDPTRIRQILLNLAGNAIKFTQQGGVKILVSFHGGQLPRLRIEVRDTGIGISDEQQGTLFQPFMQADASITRTHGGTGLGLAISKRLAEMLNGQLMVCSEIGKGSTFTLVLPIPRTEAAVLVQPTEGMFLQTSTGAVAGSVQLTGRILLAEDGEDNQRLFATHLERAGAQVETAANGEIALGKALEASAAGNAFDVILMDMQMPQMDGYTATRRLRELNITTPVIALTAHAMLSDRAKCLAAGCTDYRTKPIDREALLQVVAQYLPSQTQCTVANIAQPDASSSTKVRSHYANDPDMMEILAEYVLGMPETVAKLQELVREADLAQLKRVLHQVKGSGGGYGFDILSAQAADAEEATKAGAAMDEIQARVDSLLATMRNIAGYDESREGAYVAKNPPH